MKYKSFSIKNFKGIDNLTIKLDRLPNARIFTLVGLNESGKTTILEAINAFQNPPNDPNTLIPKSKRLSFTDNVTITVVVELDSADNKRIKEFAKKNGYTLEGDIETITRTRTFKFVASSFQEEGSGTTYSQIPLMGKKGKSQKVRKITDNDFQRKIIEFVKGELLPRIVYYPNFLSDFPEKIYLQSSEGEGKEQEFYRKVLQDVLDSLNQNITIEEHLIKRFQSGQANELQNIEHVLSTVGGKITKVVFDAWKKIAGSPPGKIEVTLGETIKKDSQDRPYIEIKIKEGTDTYFLNERSLGFRWFFTFLLFTQFRKYRREDAKNMLFLLDEPASNLHQSGQKELLSSLEQLTDGADVVYSTHSHHLINPLWLTGAFIVTNRGLNPDVQSLQDDFNATKTDITAERYFSFVSNHPGADQETHYKPILDVLDYKPSSLEQIPSLAILEGKYDYYTLGYFQDIILNLPTSERINLYPGGGAGYHENIIRLYLGWGRKFAVLLDDDKAGHEEKTRYEEMFGVDVVGRIITLGDINKDFSGFATEKLLSAKEKLDIIQTLFPSDKRYNKDHFNKAVQQLYIKKTEYAFSSETKAKMRSILEALANILSR